MRFLALIAALALAPMACAVNAQDIPAAASRYRLDLTRQARLIWGIDAPTATFAAQIHQESRWRADAVSPVGARGLAQFMPRTEAWMPTIDPQLNTTQRPGWGEPDSGSPWNASNPSWAIRALVGYDLWLWKRVAATDECQRMAKVLSAYNGGLGWLNRDERLAESAPGKGPGQADLKLRWFDGVERINSGRSASAFAENRAYPRSILLRWEPVYEAANWGAGVCP